MIQQVKEKKSILFILITVLSISSYGQKIIYSKPIVISIPGRTPETDSLIKKDTAKHVILQPFEFVELEEVIGEDFDTQLDIEIDTIVEENIKLQTLTFSFQPVIDSKKVIKDYPSGEYLLDSSGVSMKAANVVKEYIEKEILTNADSSDRIIIKIKGTADAVEIKGIRYKNEFGKKVKGKCFFKDEYHNLNIYSKKLVKTNHELAFLRTYGIRYYLEKNILRLMDFDYSFEHSLEVFDEVGGNYRKVVIEVVVLRELPI